MRVLVTGAGGQVGREVVAACRGAGDEVVDTTRRELDVAERDQVHAALLGIAPDVVVHAAAYTAVDACEADADRAFAVNALGTRHVAEAAGRAGAHVVVLSTDYVFDGAGDRPYVEWDHPNPLSVYGRSKLAAELEAGPGATIVRTSWVCGRHGSNFVKTTLRLAAERETWDVVADQRGCPTFADDLAGMVRRLARERRPGLHHVTNQGATTWYDFARDILDAAGHDRERVRPVTTAELAPPRPAPRPANAVLDNAALRLLGIPLLAEHHEPLERLVKELTT